MIDSRNGHSEVVDKLLDKGANIEAQDKVTYLLSSENLSKLNYLALMLIVMSMSHYCRMIC